MNELLRLLGEAARDAAPVAVALFAVLLVFTLAREVAWILEWIGDRIARLWRDR